MLPLALTLALAQDAGPPDPWRAHQDLAAQADDAARDGDAAAAIAACRAAIAVLPAGPRAERCLRRIEALSALRDPDGTWRSWAALEAVRRDHARLDPADAAARVAALVTAEGVNRRVADDALIWLARQSLDAPAEALGWTDLAWPRRAALPPDQARELALLRARALARLGREDEARATEAVALVPTLAPTPTPVDREVTDARRATARRAAWAALATFGLAALTRPAAPAGPPWGLLPLVGTGAFAAGLVHLRDGLGGVALALTAALAGVHLLSWRAGALPWWLRLLAAAASAAAAWLVLDAAGRLGEVGA